MEQKMTDKNIMKSSAFSGIIKFLKRNSGTLLGCFILMTILTFSTDAFLTKDNLINVLRQVSINGILAVAMTAVILLGGIDLSVGSVVAASGCLTAVALMNGYPLWLAILAGIASGAVFGFINGLIVSRTVIPAFIVTLATQTAIRGIGYIFTNGYPVTVDNAGFNFIGSGYIGIIPVPVVIMACIIFVMFIILTCTKFGRYMYAIGGNRETAKYSGINVKNVELIVYVIAGVLASIAGIILASRLYSGQPTVGTGFEGDAIAATVLGGTSFTGGVGTIGGTVVGTLIIGILNNGLNLLKISFYWQLVVKGIVIIAAVYFDTSKDKIKLNSLKSLLKKD